MQINLNDEIRRRALKMIREIGRIVEEEIEPIGTRDTGRCTDCEYSRYCEGHQSEEQLCISFPKMNENIS